MQPKADRESGNGLVKAGMTGVGDVMNLNRLLGDKYDEEDLEFLDSEDRAKALGLDLVDPVTVVSSVYDMGEDSEIPEITPLDRKERSPTTAQRPLPGWIKVRLDQVARSRGVINARGNYKGLPSITAISRGTDVTVSTVQALLNDSERLAMIHFGTLARLCDFLKCQPGDLLVYHKGMVRPASSFHGKDGE